MALDGAWHEDSEEIVSNVHLIVQNKIFNLKKYLLYMEFEPRTLTLSFLRSTDFPLPAEIHYMVFIYVYIVNLRESRFP